MFEKILFIVDEDYDKKLRNIALSCLASIVQLRMDEKSYDANLKIFKQEFKTKCLKIQESYKDTELEDLFESILEPAESDPTEVIY